ncbi:MULTISPECIES: CHAD domain-containing protein [Paenibacillus]|uniref:CHAD domain-containing protein n=1 Tax=Paenibacillus TaxID=44249 RepID=UPI0022B85F9C|nr:CHAD domain-containing protein [Paenibacillus caseinilyticus]MCZ8522947.1 CHAD domain-containing protein [Paenibacillus caseinilyticus]
METLQERTETYREWKKQLKRHYRKFAAFAKEAYRYEDVEDVHQARVHCRKLLTLLKLLDPEDQEGLRAPLRGAFKALGKVRDSDVLLADFEDRKAEAPDKETAEMLKRYLKQLRDRRLRYVARLEKRLRPALRGKFRRRWETYLNGALREQAAAADATAQLRKLEAELEAKQSDLRDLAARPDTSGLDLAETLHEARLIVKEIRYVTSEADFALKPLPGGELSLLPVKPLQEELGALNDSRVRLARWQDANPQALGTQPEVYRRMTDRLRGEMERRIREVSLTDPEELD